MGEVCMNWMDRPSGGIVLPTVSPLYHPAKKTLTALHRAVLKHSPSALARAIKDGTDGINAVDEHGRTALHYLVLNEADADRELETGLCKMLLNAGATVHLADVIRILVFGDQYLVYGMDSNDYAIRLQKIMHLPLMENGFEQFQQERPIPEPRVFKSIQKGAVCRLVGLQQRPELNSRAVRVVIRILETSSGVWTLGDQYLVGEEMVDGRWEVQYGYGHMNNLLVKEENLKLKPKTHSSKEQAEEMLKSLKPS